MLLNPEHTHAKALAAFRAAGGRVVADVPADTDLVIDVVAGRGGMFSLDNGREKRFLTRSEVCRT